MVWSQSLDGCPTPPQTPLPLASQSEPPSSPHVSSEGPALPLLGAPPLPLGVSPPAPFAPPTPLENSPPTPFTPPPPIEVSPPTPLAPTFDDSLLEHAEAMTAIALITQKRSGPIHER